MLEVNHLRKHYRTRGHAICAVDDVTVSLASGGSLAIAGSSGAGKSTLARCIAGWERPDAGTIRMEGDVQLISQDPGMSLNPRMTALQLAAEPLIVKRKPSTGASTFLALCGLPPECFLLRPPQLSGGQKARIAIARALAANPALLVFDESMISLDLIARGEILEMLSRLRAAQGLSYLWILHDLDLAGSVADEIAVMDGGRLVERASSRALPHTASHPATLALLQARLQRRWQS